MIRSFKAALTAAISAIVFFNAPAAWALSESQSYQDEAFAYIAEAEEAEAAGDYATACSAYGSAWGKFDWMHDALLEESRSRVSVDAYGRPTEDTYLKASLREVNENSRQVHNLKVAACAKAAEMPQGAPRSYEITFINSARPDLSADVTALQATINSAFSFATESARLRKARSFEPSCARARAAAVTYAKAKDEASALLKKSSSYHEVGVRDMGALEEIVSQSSRDAENFYCKPPQAVASFKAELAAFAALKSALHLERGSVTPLASQQAVTMKSACSTKAIGDAIDAESVFADALLDGCQSFIFMYNMQMPDRACDTLAKATINLSRAEPIYAAQATALATDFVILQGAFKCARSQATPIAEARSRSDSEGMRLDVIEPELPPMKLDIKALPVRDN
ncbi:MAG: hypothetical protein ABL928_11875 [Sphingorhabdus sp.]